MSSPNDERHHSKRGLMAVILLVLGTIAVTVSSRALYALSNPWASDSPHRRMHFIGILLFGFGCVLAWDLLAARALTPEEKYFRDSNEEREEERRRLFGD